MSDNYYVDSIIWKKRYENERSLNEALSVRLAEVEAERDRLREALKFYGWENETRLPSEGPWGANSTDFGKIARAALSTDD